MQRPPDKIRRPLTSINIEILILMLTQDQFKCFPPQTWLSEANLVSTGLFTRITLLLISDIILLLNHVIIINYKYKRRSSQAASKANKLTADAARRG